MKVSYKKLWKLLIDKDMKKKDLQTSSGISSSSIAKLSKNEYVSMDILVKVCTALNVDISDIVELVPDVDKESEDKKMAKKEKKKVSLEAGLWAACNKLRGSVSATDYVNVVLGLLFLRFAYDKFNEQREKLLADEDKKDFVDNPKFYSRDNIFYLEEHDRWSYIKDNSKKNNIFTIIDDAFKNIEKNNISLKGALPIGFYLTLRIEPSKFSSLIDEIHKIEYSREESDDVIGRVYEYFLRKFCIAAKSEKGEFYTPANIVELMTMLIQPYNGSVYDPCCGSGGMFVQSAEFIKNHKGNKKDITIYGQEANDKTYKLARMNLAIRGLIVT